MSACCEVELRKTDKWVSGYNRDGDRWLCPVCRRSWTYVEDEGEGGLWYESYIAEILKKGEAS
jgi:hypothetical protein